MRDIMQFIRYCEAVVVTNLPPPVKFLDVGNIAFVDFNLGLGTFDTSN